MKTISILKGKIYETYCRNGQQADRIQLEKRQAPRNL